MTLPGWTPLALATALYLWQAWEYYTRGQFPLMAVFVGYAIANCALIWDFVSRVSKVP